MFLAGIVISPLLIRCSHESGTRATVGVRSGPRNRRAAMLATLPSPARGASRDTPRAHVLTARLPIF
jgi:hypothetical protein